MVRIKSQYHSCSGESRAVCCPAGLVSAGGLNGCFRGSMRENPRPGNRLIRLHRCHGRISTLLLYRIEAAEKWLGPIRILHFPMQLLPKWVSRKLKSPSRPYADSDFSLPQAAPTAQENIRNHARPPIQGCCLRCSFSQLFLLCENNLRQRRAGTGFAEGVVGVDDRRLAVLRVDGNLEEIEQGARAGRASDASGADDASVV